ncbi:MAG: protocatechuate 4,5-dioxygenase subunit alpha, partial [Caulobacteraceae bacterium]
SLMKDSNRKTFLADEAGYLGQYKLSDEAKTAIMTRDWNTLLDLGAVSYALAKLAFTDKHSYQYMAAEMTGMSQDGYMNMMIAGGRSVEGWRSKKERGEA